MEREWSGNARRLSRSDRAEIERPGPPQESYRQQCFAASVSRFFEPVSGALSPAL